MSKIFLGALVALIGACTPSSASPTRSPSNDFEPPATTTGNGEVMGADRVPPGQKLQEGVKLDSQEGVQPAVQPPKE